ncbi:hypothetical protein LB505_013013 [Fusarium chuoi]|nr:hypothetical protein LB505_013013 [Fusarium chuoi]
MAPTDVLLSDIAGCINQMDVRQAIITPTVAKLLNPTDVPRFETLIVGGEPLTSDVIKTWAPHCKILNVYGPTETSMVPYARGLGFVSTELVTWHDGYLMARSNALAAKTTRSRFTVIALNLERLRMPFVTRVSSRMQLLWLPKFMIKSTWSHSVPPTMMPPLDRMALVLSNLPP